MWTVYKYPLPLSDYDTRITMPVAAEILTVQEQHGALAIWARVTPDDGLTKDRTFRVVGTGHEAPSPSAGRYVGTVQQISGALLWHVFEIIG